MNIKKIMSIVITVCLLVAQIATVAYADEIPAETLEKIEHVAEKETTEEKIDAATPSNAEKTDEATPSVAKKADIILEATAEDGMKVTLKAEADAFNNEGELSLAVTLVKIDVKEEATLDAVEKENVAKRVTYDITVLDEGAPIEPVKEVNVSFKLSDVPSGADGVNIYHHDEETGIEKIATQVLKKDAKEEIGDVDIVDDVTVDSFSLYTVDFTYKDMTVSIASNSTGNKLDDIVNQLGIEEKVEEAEAYKDAECTEEAANGEVKNEEGDTLFSVYESGDSWYVDAVNAFQTEHGLIIKTVDGAEYKIKVTDSIASVTYLDADGTEETCTTYTVVTASSSAVTWNEGWYVVEGGTENSPITIPGVIVTGNVHLILKDGCHITVTGTENNAGITVLNIPPDNPTNVLTIYGQENGTGKLTASGGNRGAGIGGGHQQHGNNITINGGTIIATGGNDSAGIGGGSGAAGTHITINAGTVTATGRSGGAGIGGGQGNAGGDITINGGTVTATGGDISGIGGSSALYIKIATTSVIKADVSNPPTTVITNTGGDLTSSLAGKQYVKVVTETSITFDAGEGTAGTKTQVTATYGGVMPTLLSSELPTRSGYTFSGYFDAATGGTKYYNADGTSAKNWYNAGFTATLYAHWTVNTYTVTLEANGGSGGKSSIEATYGNAMPALLESDLPTRTGYTFAGYFDAMTSGIKYYNADGSSVKNWDKTESTVTLYAQWTGNPNTPYTVQHYQQNVSDSGYTLIDTENLKGTTGEQTAAEAKAYPGFTADTICQQAILGDGTTNVNVYYTRNTYTVTFKSDGQTHSTQQVKYGALLDEPSEPSKSSGTFCGWYKENTFENAWNFSTDTMPANGISLYAKWIYTVTFDANGGSGTMPSMTTSTGKIILPANGFTAPRGKKFAGWGVGSAMGEVKAPGTEVVFAEDGTVYAIWEYKKESSGGEWTLAPTAIGSSSAPVSNGTWVPVNGTFKYMVNGEPFRHAKAWITYTAADGKQYTGCFYFDKLGNMATGWQLINGVWYYFEPAAGPTQGIMYISRKTPDGYAVDAEGKWVQE